MKSLTRVQLFATPWTVAYQAPPSTGFSRQKYGSGLPFPSPGQFPLKKKKCPCLMRKETRKCMLCGSGWYQMWRRVLGKKDLWKCGRPMFDPRVGRCPGEGNGNPLQYSCLENSMDRGFWWPAVHGVTKSRTRLRD